MWMAFLQVEMLDDCSGVGGVVVHVVAATDLARPAMAAPIMGDDAVALFDEVEHLRIPVVSAQRPSVMKDDRLTGTPVIVKDSNISASFFANINIIHFCLLPPEQC